MFKTPFSTWEPQWAETEHEVFRDFGYAAFAAQVEWSSLTVIAPNQANAPTQGDSTEDGAQNTSD